MRKAFIVAPQQARLDEVPGPTLQPGEVLVRIARGSLCSSDVGHWRTGPRNPQQSDPFGHDASGVVEALGPAVEDIAVGQAVTIAGWMPCGTCRWCLAGRVLRCLSRVAPRPDQAGFFSQYMAIPAPLAIPLPPGVTLDDGALIEAAYTGINGSRVMGFGPGDLVVLIGSGWMAWGQIAVAASLGARPVAIARNDRRLALAQRFGAIATFHTDDAELPAKLAALNGGDPPDYFIDATGAFTPDGMAQAQRLGAIGAIIGLMGRKRNLALEEFMFKHQQIRAIAVAPIKAEAVAMIATGKLDLKPCISHRFPFARLPDALQLLASNRDEVTKIMIDFD